MLITPPQNLYPNYLLYRSLLNSLRQNPITLPTVKTWKLESKETACIYTELANNTMDLSQASLPTADIAAGYTLLEIKAIAVYCRPDYNSVDFPDNPRFVNL
jgi:hypothetical protein